MAITVLVCMALAPDNPADAAEASPQEQVAQSFGDCRLHIAGKLGRTEGTGSRGLIKNTCDPCRPYIDILLETADLYRSIQLPQNSSS